MLSKQKEPIMGVRALTVGGMSAFDVPMHGCFSGEKNEQSSENPREKSSEKVGS